jgi:VanZ family protein
MTKRLRQSDATANSSTLRRLVRYGPLLLWIGFISFASTGEFSSDSTSRFVRPFLLWLFPGISEGQLAGVHFVTRKVSHLAEYAILAFLARRAFITSSHAFIQRRWFQVSLALVVVCSLLDEFKQSYEPARSASMLDCVIDVIGGLTVLYLFKNYDRRAQRRREFVKRD